MKKLRFLVSLLGLLPVLVLAEPIVDETAVKKIHAEMSSALKSGNTDAMMNLVKKYLYPGSKIIVDMSPEVNEGEMEIEYEMYMPMLEMGLQMMTNADVHEDILAISVDKKLNQATIEVKTIANIEMLGVKMEDVSVSETTYGVVDGEIKILLTKDTIISSSIEE